jgi:hypothetical protein
VTGDVAGWKLAVRALEAMHRQPKLAQIVRALDSPSRLASRLDRRQKQRHQDADDRQHNQ